ncbi:MAG: tol-pal system protein YbgF [Pseudomonadota bacterium]
MKKLVLILLTVTLVTAGCGVTKEEFTRQSAYVRSLQTEVQDLKNQSQLRDMELERRIGQSRQSLPDIRLELDNMRTDVQRLTNSMDMAEYTVKNSDGKSTPLGEQLERVRARLDRLEAALSLPPLSSDAAPPATGPNIEGSPDALGGEPGSNAPAGEPESVIIGGETPSSDEPADKADYKIAEALYKRQAFPAAQEKFKDFVANHGNSEFAPAAQFFVGECLYNQQKYEEAILEYQKVVKKFPKSMRVPGALFKQAFAFLSIGDKTSAKLLFQKVMREHPKSYWSGVAEKKLATLN